MSKEVVSLIIKTIARKDAKETCICDICGRQIYKKSLEASEELPKNTLFVSFYEAYTGHDDWGNDSCDSCETHHICSPECLTKLFTAYTNATSRDKRSSWWLEVKHEITSAYEGNGEQPKEYKGYSYLMSEGSKHD